MGAVVRAKATYTHVVSDERTGVFDRRGYQQTVRGIPVLKMMQPIGAGGGTIL